MDPASLFFVIGPRVYWPFFDYPRIKNRVRVEDARFQQAITTYQDHVLSASQEVEDGIIGFLKTLEATSSQQNAVAAARRSVELASLQYREGAVDYQRVLDSNGGIQPGAYNGYLPLIFLFNQSAAEGAAVGWDYLAQPK